MSVALLDINVLLALAWPNHQHHAPAHAWFAAKSRGGWATCAFTQLGFVRLSSNPSFTPDAVSPREAANLLRKWTRHRTHHFWPSPPAEAVAIYDFAIGHQQVNDAWLVEVARCNSGRVATLDVRIPAHSGNKALVEIIETAGLP